MKQSTAPQLPKLTARERAKLLMSLGVIKAKGIKPYRVAKRPPPTDKPTSTNRKPVRCIDTGEEFASVTSAAHAHGVMPSNLSSHLKGYLQRVGGRQYEYIKDKTNPQYAKPHHATTPRKVRCITDGQVFRSISACAQHYGIALSGLHNHLNGKQRSVGIRQFEFI